MKRYRAQMIVGRHGELLNMVHHLQIDGPLIKETHYELIGNLQYLNPEPVVFNPPRIWHHSFLVNYKLTEEIE